MYSTASYGRMVADRVRMEAYHAALAAVVRPGAVVVDLGTGTGVMACLAARLGAAHVYAVEPSDAIQVAREVAAANGLAERITFLQCLGSEVRLPAPADAVVSDLRGILPLLGHNLQALADARARLLRPGGALIPLRDRIHAAPVEAPARWAGCVAPSDADAFGLDVEPARRHAADGWYQVHLEPGQLLAGARPGPVVDYLAPPVDDVAATFEWTVERDGQGHGIAAWFDAELAPGIGFSNAPGAPPAVYGQALFPWPRPVALRLGDRVRVALRAHLAGENWMWEWRSVVEGADGGETARFRQSTLRDVLPSLARLRRGVPGHVPLPGPDAEVLREVLARMDGRRTVRDIAAEVAALFPDAFAGADAALERVALLSREWSR